MSGRTSTRVRVRSAEVRFCRERFATPLVLSTGRIEAITRADARVHAACNGVESIGRGCIYLSDLWAWPSAQFSHARREAAMRDECLRLADRLPHLLDEQPHPLVAGMAMHEHVVTDERPDVAAAPPLLARAVCASIFDAAIHDAVGQALGRSAFALYDQPLSLPTCDPYFGAEGGAFRAIRGLLSRGRQIRSPAWWLIGKSDDLERDVRPPVSRRGYSAFKIKIMGRDAGEDAKRVIEVASAARRWGVAHPRVSIDSNEANPDARSVAGFLDVLETLDPAAYEALELIEQPTGRDISQHAYDWRPIAARKPVVVDEGLTTLEAMDLARAQGWSGFAIKTCKGHSFALIAAAYAHRFNLELSLQDLTNPALAAVHAGLFAAHVPTLNGVELNSPQFTPEANRGWDMAFPGLFDVRDGRHVLPDPSVAGLGGHHAEAIDPWPSDSCVD